MLFHSGRNLWPGLVRSKLGHSSVRYSSYSSARSSLFQLTTLPNGLRVATDGLPGHFSALGLYVDAGSRYETEPWATGLSHLMDRLAYQSTLGTTAEQMEERLGSLGGNYMCVSSREAVIYQAAVFNRDVAAMFELLAATVRWPQITQTELEIQKETAAYEIGEIWQKPELILPELLHAVAYQDNTLGLPLLVPEERLPSIRVQDIVKYREQFYTPERIVAAFVGVEHEVAVELVTRYFGDMSKGTYKPKSQPALYTGGVQDMGPMPVQHVPNQPELAQILVAFEGLSINDPDIYALATLQTLLGGGGSFSAGGPGKGMYSRLYTMVLNRYGFVDNCVAFNHSYTDSGLFGISVSCLPSHANMVAPIICGQLAYCMSQFTRSGGIQEAEVHRAKNQLRSSLLMNLESKMVELEDVGRQVQVVGKRVPVEEMCEKIDRLSLKDVVNVATRVLRGNSRPSIIMLGREGVFGDVEGECRKWGLGA
ncbi:Metalloenzyme, LuxS/M16 peptidase-like protein [Lipomyces oligophaga]|uniref:Metalloenzyme, LuxS/M16 peptidase-like protein n=1 Tax=Lipomyces oligophaga TaxID=45792 RepID=UPI0034CD646B